VSVAIEVALGKDLRGVMEGLVLDEDRAEDGALRLHAVRERPLEHWFRRQIHSLSRAGALSREPPTFFLLHDDGKLTVTSGWLH
jgi:hypothetical protein